MLRYVLRGATYIHIAASTLRATMIWDSMWVKKPPVRARNSCLGIGPSKKVTDWRVWENDASGLNDYHMNQCGSAGVSGGGGKEREREKEST